MDIGSALQAVIVAAVVAVIVIVLAVWRLARRVIPHRPLTTVFLVVLGAMTLPLGLVAWLLALRIQLTGRRGDAGLPHAAGQWGRWARAARQAGQRYDAQIATLPPGPLRERLEDLRGDVVAAITEAGRLAAAGSRLDASRKPVARRLGECRAAAAKDPHDTALGESIEALAASAARLEGAISDTRRRLRLVVARLDELVANAAELTVWPDVDGSSSQELVDQVVSLREAAGELARV